MLYNPIVTSRLDNDFYNFTMGQLVWRHFPTVEVTYRFINRTTGVKLGHLIDPAELAEALETVRYARLTHDERNYLASLDLFDPSYLDYLEELVMPPVQLSANDSELSISYSGPWPAAIFWETPLLAIVNELANRTRGAGREAELHATGERRLAAKIARLKAHPEVRFTEFGTRRRASFGWQEHVLTELAREVPAQLMGTSNVELARRTGLRPSGTMAHQLFMVTTALAEAEGSVAPIASAQRQVLDLYEAEYADKWDGRLLIFLPDTYGTETALALLEPERAERWAGFRQDSGDPFEIGEHQLDYYDHHGIDAHTKSQFFSDGLDVETMIALAARFGGRSKVAFGWGTNATNDVGLPPLSMVVKPVAANGHPAGKLSDNLAKATGEPATIEHLRAEANYHVTYRTAPVY